MKNWQYRIWICPDVEAFDAKVVSVYGEKEAKKGKDNKPIKKRKGEKAKVPWDGRASPKALALSEADEVRAWQGAFTVEELEALEQNGTSAFVELFDSTLEGLEAAIQAAPDLPWHRLQVLTRNDKHTAAIMARLRELFPSGSAGGLQLASVKDGKKGKEIS